MAKGWLSRLWRPPGRRARIGALGVSLALHALLALLVLSSRPPPEPAPVAEQPLEIEILAEAPAEPAPAAVPPESGAASPARPRQRVPPPTAERPAAPVPAEEPTGTVVD